MKVLRIHDREVESFRDTLSHADRDCPVVYCSLSRESGEPLIDTDRLAKSLAGNAIVAIPASTDASEGYHRAVPRLLSAVDGTVRVYMPRLDLDGGQRESNRHYFFPPSSLTGVGAESALESLVDSLARRYSHEESSPAATVDDIRSQIETDRLRAQLASVPQDKKPDWAIELEDQFYSVTSTNEELKHQLKDALRSKDESDDSLKRESSRRRSLEQQLAGYRSVEARSDAASTLLVHFGLGGKNLCDLLKHFANAFPNQITVCPEALKSAADAGINQQPTQLPTASKLLWHLATTMHELISNRSCISSTLPGEFKARTGFEIAMTEGKQTKADTSAMRERKRIVDGEEVDISPHLKLGNSKSSALRIHFGWMFTPEGDTRIVIGHCGDHLKTAGTRRVR